MKRSFALILALVFILTAILVSCESSEVEKEEEKEKEKGTAAIDTNVEVIVDGNDNVVFDFFNLDEESEAKE